MTEGKSGHVVKNWAGTHICRPQLYFEPNSEDDLRQILSGASEASKKVKVVGNAYSFTDIHHTEDFMVSMKHFDRILEIDQSAKTVKVEAGIVMTKLNDSLAENNLALSVLGFISEMTLGGALATGYHGSGIRFGTLQDYVLELGLMVGDGEILKLSCDDDATEMFNAACLSLGALGIIVYVKLQCEPAFNLQQVTYAAKLDDVIRNIDSHLTSSEHFRFALFPHTDNCVVYEIDRTDKLATEVERSWFWEKFVGFYLMEFAFWLSTFLPCLIPWISGAYSRLGFLIGRREMVARSDHVFNFPIAMRATAAEWAFPRTKFAEVMCELREWFKTNYTLFPLEMRFVQRGKTLLSPNLNADVCYINILVWQPYGKFMAYDEHFDGFAAILRRAGGKPHLGQSHTITAQQMKTIFKQPWDRFLEIRQKLDPGNLFVNAHIKRLLGD